jgi:hypothetical protein
MLTVSAGIAWATTPIALELLGDSPGGRGFRVNIDCSVGRAEETA